MTLRRRLRTIVLSTALVSGGLVAVPLATSTAAAAAPVIRNDPLAPVAQHALDSLVEFDATGDLEAHGTYNIGPAPARRRRSPIGCRSTPSPSRPRGAPPTSPTRRR